MSEVAPPVRVLRVIARMNLGGPAHHVVILTSQLDQRGYESLLVTGNVGAGEEEHAAVEGINPRHLQSLGPEIRPLQDFRALLSLSRIVRRFRPEILHTHTAKAGLLGRTAVFISAKPRPKVVHTYHGHVLSGYFGKVKTGVFRFLERSLARTSDRLIGVSAATVDELVELQVAPRDKFRVIPLGLELDGFLNVPLVPDQDIRAELGVAPEDVLFTYTGRLVPIKNPDRMLRAVAAARKAGAPVKVAVVGDGELRPGMEALAEELGCAEAILFLGYRRDLARIAAASDAALLTSDNEGTPVALIEASAAGRPAVATNVGGVADIVVEGTGFLAPVEDEGLLAEQIVRLATDSELRREMGAKAREHVRERYSAQRLVDDVDALYRELLESPPVR